jgi:hypothetical protein
MPAKKIRSLHFNLPHQDAYTGGPNVIFHRSHRTKKNRKDIHYEENDEYWDLIQKKFEKIDEIEEKRYKNLTD